jgi:hypothetical protein
MLGGALGARIDLANDFDSLASTILKRIFSLTIPITIPIAESSTPLGLTSPRRILLRPRFDHDTVPRCLGRCDLIAEVASKHTWAL